MAANRTEPGTPMTRERVGEIIQAYDPRFLLSAPDCAPTPKEITADIRELGAEIILARGWATVEELQGGGA